MQGTDAYSAYGGLAWLPLDVIVQIVAYAPLKARLCTLSLVCTRWRTAVTRSVDSLALKASLLPMLLPRFPSITALAITETKSAVSSALPTTLRSLQLCSPPYLLDKPVYASILAQRFPHLESLTVADQYHQPPQLMRAFLLAHSTQLTHLGLQFSGHSPSFLLPALTWPALRTFSVENSALMGDLALDAVCAPQLALNCGVHSYLTTSAEHLCALTSLDLSLNVIDGYTEADLLGRLPLSPFLRRLTWESHLGHGNVNDFHNSLLKLMLRFFTNATASTGSWDELSKWSRLETLKIAPSFTSVPTAMTLPHLHTVHVGSSTEGMPSAQCLGLASAILRTHPHVRVMLLNFRRSTSKRHCSAVKAFLDLAIARGLRRLTLLTSYTRAISAMCAEVLASGWLDLEIIDRNNDSDASDADDALTDSSWDDDDRTNEP